MLNIDTPFRAAALGILVVAGIVLIGGLATGRRYRSHVLVLTLVALGLVAASEILS